MKCLLLVLAVAVPVLAACQAAQSPPVLTEELVVTIALNNNPTLAQAQAEAGMARARVAGARSEHELQVSANGLAALSNMGNAILVPGVMPQAILGSQDRTSLDVNVMAMVPLDTGGRIKNSIRASELDSAAFEALLEGARVEVAYMARMRFAEWQAAVASAKVADDALPAQAEQTRVSEQMVDAGKAPRFDLLRNQAALASRQQDVAAAEAEVAVAKAKVAQVLGTAVETFSEPANERREALPADLLAAALATRPDLAAAQHSTERATALVASSKASFKPQVYGVGMADLLAPSVGNDNIGLTVGVVAGIPLVDGGRRRAEVDEAQQGVLRAQAAVSTLELQVKAEVVAAQARLGAAQQNIGTAGAQVTAADEGYKVAQVRYAAGKSAVVELLDSLQALTEAQQGLVKARANLSGAYAEMYRALGVAVPGRK